MRSSIAASLLASFALTALPAAAASSCVDVEDRDERLKCYDAENRATPPVTERSGERKKSAVKTDAAETAKPVQMETTVVDGAPTAKQAEAKPNNEKTKSKKSKKVGKDVYPHRVVKITRSGTDKKFVYELDNGERWVQTKTQVVTIRENDAVAIRSTFTGRNIIATARGATAWVKRLR